MDWTKVKDEGYAHRQEPALRLIELCWRLQAPHGQRVVSCGIYAVEGPGIEVRCGFSDDDLLRSQRSAEIASAREVAAKWKAAVLAKGRFTELAAE
jgi:hypothetical protein